MAKDKKKFKYTAEIRSVMAANSPDGSIKHENIPVEDY
jgi:hypothetical protein